MLHLGTCTQHMTKINVTSSRLLDKHFLFFNLSQNIYSLKDILQIIWTLMGSLFKGPAPSAWYQKKGLVILYFSFSTSVQKFLTVLKISVQVNFRGWTCNYLKGPHRNKRFKFVRMKGPPLFQGEIITK